MGVRRSAEREGMGGEGRRDPTCSSSITCPSHLQFKSLCDPGLVVYPVYILISLPMKRGQQKASCKNCYEISYVKHLPWYVVGMQ